VQVQAESSPV